MRKFNAFVSFNLRLTTTTIFNATTSDFKASTLSRDEKTQYGYPLKSNQHNEFTRPGRNKCPLSTTKKRLYDCPRCIFFNYLRSSANCQSKFREFRPSEKSKCDKIDTGPGPGNALILGKQANLPR